MHELQKNNDPDPPKDNHRNDACVESITVVYTHALADVIELIFTQVTETRETLRPCERVRLLHLTKCIGEP